MQILRQSFAALTPVIIALQLISYEGNTTREFRITNNSSEILPVTPELYITYLPNNDTIFSVKKPAGRNPCQNDGTEISINNGNKFDESLLKDKNRK
jgi:hypothetical protein